MEVKIINDKRCFVYQKEEKEPIDMIALRMMEENRIEGLLPFKYIQQGENRYFRYEAEEGESLAEWLERAQSKRSVVKTLESLILVSKEMEAYLLDQKGISTELPFVMVRNDNCELAYIPLEKEKQGDILELAHRIVLQVRYVLDEDFTYLFDLQNAFGRGDIQNLTDLKKWLRVVKGEEEKYLQADQEKVEENSNPYTFEPLKAVPQPPAREEYGNDTFEGIFEGLNSENRKERKQDKKRDKKVNEKQGFHFRGKKKNQEEAAEVKEEAPVRQSSFRKEIINDLDRGDSTVMITGTMTVLVQVKNGMEYGLSGDSYVIGSGNQADIVVSNNPTISRRHARIFTANGSFYIEDLGSTNGTSVNGERLRKMEPYKLNHKARIRLSNEEYFFEIRG